MNKKKVITGIVFSIMTALVSAVPVFAAGFGDSTLATGTENLLNDITTWALIILPAVSALLIVYFAIRRGAAGEEHEAVRWEKKMKVVLVCLAVGVGASSIIKVIVSYYQ